MPGYGEESKDTRRELSLEGDRPQKGLAGHERKTTDNAYNIITEQSMPLHLDTSYFSLIFPLYLGIKKSCETINRKSYASVLCA